MRVLTTLALLRTMRARSDSSVARFYARLAEAVGPARSLPPVLPSSAAPDYSPRFATVFRRTVNRLPRLFRQNWHLARSTVPDEVVVVAVSARRLHGISEVHDDRAFLSACLRPLPMTPDPRLAAAVREAPCLLLADPSSDTALWDRPVDRWRRNVFVLDPTFLVVHLAVTPWAWVEFWRSAAKERRERTRLDLGLLEFVSAMALAISYRSILRRFRHGSAVLLTSNSFATEVLRTELLENPAIESVTEVLHGSPSIDYVDYLTSITDVGGKHRVVPQNGPDVVAKELNPASAVISVQNNRWAAQHEGGKPLGRLVEQLLDHSQGDRPFVVTIAGGAKDQDYVASVGYRIERLYALATVEWFADHELPVRLIYAPHPLNPVERFQIDPVMTNAKVLFVTDTVVTHLVSDITIGLMTSAVFDAALAGALALTPAVSADGLFSEELLGRAWQSRSAGSSPLRALHLALETAAAAPRGGLMERAVERAARLGISLDMAELGRDRSR